MSDISHNPLKPAISSATDRFFANIDKVPSISAPDPAIQMGQNAIDKQEDIRKRMSGLSDYFFNDMLPSMGGMGMKSSLTMENGRGSTNGVPPDYLFKQPLRDAITRPDVRSADPEALRPFLDPASYYKPTSIDKHMQLEYEKGLIPKDNPLWSLYNTKRPNGQTGFEQHAATNLGDQLKANVESALDAGVDPTNMWFSRNPAEKIAGTNMIRSAMERANNPKLATAISHIQNPDPYKLTEPGISKILKRPMESALSKDWYSKNLNPIPEDLILKQQHIEGTAPYGYSAAEDLLSPVVNEKTPQDKADALKAAEASALLNYSGDAGAMGKVITDYVTKQNDALSKAHDFLQNWKSKYKGGSE